MTRKSHRNVTRKPKRQSRRVGGAKKPEKGKKMPTARIDAILKYEKSSNISRYMLKLPDLTDDELERMRTILVGLRFRQSDIGDNPTKFWTNHAGNFESAVNHAIAPM
jgi:hypothetical protein